MEDAVLPWLHVSQGQEDNCANNHESRYSPVPITSTSGYGNVSGGTVDSVAFITLAIRSFVTVAERTINSQGIVGALLEHIDGWVENTSKAI